VGFGVGLFFDLCAVSIHGENDETGWVPAGSRRNHKNEKPARSDVRFFNEW
jgi:hypothetical protein